MSAGKVGVLAVIDGAGLDYDRQREDAERLGQPGTAIVYQQAAEQCRAACAAVAELIEALKRIEKAAQTGPRHMQIGPGYFEEIEQEARAALAKVTP